ncbi:hypothetical protein EST38_g5566 [Candolleomyces aberdarensis]|uniref:Uncharacterized protein n=1 Tax=Candolleomyces aberdarensis TaxID=2316362 RepID=A0A4Q2DK54_9AGAR|nr:hypothetical protein EST38_g5566 [Candolleomyces aberdarensis]
MKKNQSGAYRESAMKLFAGRHSEAAVKDQWERSRKTFLWIVQYNKFTANRGGDGEATSDYEAGKLAQSSKKLAAARKARVLGNESSLLSDASMEDRSGKKKRSLLVLSDSDLSDSDNARKSGGVASLLLRKPSRPVHVSIGRQPPFLLETLPKLLDGGPVQKLNKRLRWRLRVR